MSREPVGNVGFEVADAANLSQWKDQSFDKVAAIDFVEHVDDEQLELILSEAARVLVPGGRLAIYTPCASHYVERMKERNFILKQIPVHIAVRRPEAYDMCSSATGLTSTPSGTRRRITLFSGSGPTVGAVAGDRRVLSLSRICMVARRRASP